MQQTVSLAARLSIGRDKEIMHGETDGTISRVVSAPVQRFCELANDVNENVFVMLRCSAEHRWRHLDRLVSVLAVPLPDA